MASRSVRQDTGTQPNRQPILRAYNLLYCSVCRRAALPYYDTDRYASRKQGHDRSDETICSITIRLSSREKHLPKAPEPQTPEPAPEKTNPTPSDSVFSPPMPAGHALIEARHGLVGTADLDLVEGGLVAVALAVGALGAALLRVVPGAGPAEDVLPLLALVDAPREHGLGDGVLEGTCAALEPVRALVGQRHREDVGAVRADWEGGFESEHRRERAGLGVLTEQHVGRLDRKTALFVVARGNKQGLFPTILAGIGVTLRQSSNRNEDSHHQVRSWRRKKWWGPAPVTDDSVSA